MPDRQTGIFHKKRATSNTKLPSLLFSPTGGFAQSGFRAVPPGASAQVEPTEATSMRVHPGPLRSRRAGASHTFAGMEMVNENNQPNRTGRGFEARARCDPPASEPIGQAGSPETEASSLLREPQAVVRTRIYWGHHEETCTSFHAQDVRRAFRRPRLGARCLHPAHGGSDRAGGRTRPQRYHQRSSSHGHRTVRRSLDR